MHRPSAKGGFYSAVSFQEKNKEEIATKGQGHKEQDELHCSLNPALRPTSCLMHVFPAVCLRSRETCFTNTHCAKHKDMTDGAWCISRSTLRAHTVPPQKCRQLTLPFHNKYFFLRRLPATYEFIRVSLSPTLRGL